MNDTELKKVYTTPEQISAMYEELEKASGPRGKQLKGFKTVMSVLGKVVFLSFLVLILIFVINVRMLREQGESPSVLGFSVYNVKSGSMTPTLPVDSIFLSRRYQGQELEVGTIVTFLSHEGKRISHRIVEKNTDGKGKIYYRTKGDNPNNSVDLEWLYPEQIEAVFVTRLFLF